VDGKIYSFRLRYVKLDESRGGWCAAVTHTVEGKSAAPSYVQDFNVYQSGQVVTAKWTAVLDKDLAGYEIRYIEFDEDAAVTWAAATLLNGSFSGTTFTTTEAPTGNWVFMIKAIDTSGNYSANAAEFPFQVNAIYEILSNVRAWPLWKGTLTNCVRDPMTGYVYPESQDSAAGNDNNWIDNYCLNPYTDFTYEPEEINLGAIYGARAFTTIYKTKPGWENETQQEAHTNTTSKAYVDYINALPFDNPHTYEEVTAIGISILMANTRYVQFKLVVTNADGLIKLLDFSPVVDTSEAVA